MDATVSIHVSVTDKWALWDAAAANAVSSGSHVARSDYKAEFGIDRVADHLRFLIDRPLSPKFGSIGFDVVDSFCEVDAEPVSEPGPEGSAKTALQAAYAELSEHPAGSSRDDALSTLSVVRSMLQICLDVIPDGSAGPVFDHLRKAYRDVTTDVGGLPENDANQMITDLADQLRPIVLAFAPVDTVPEAAVEPDPYAHLGPAPEVPEGQRLFVARQERDAIVTYEAYVVAEDARDAQALAFADQCTWIESGTGELDDRTIIIETPDLP